MNYDNTYVKIDLDAIRENLDAVKKRTGVKVMAVIKADAYGHGAVQVARLLEPESAFFGVSSVAEALELRQSGIRIPILILGHTPVSAYPQVVQWEIRPAIFRREDAEELSRVAMLQKKTACFHFVVDTGMSRIGLECTEASADLCVELSRLPGL